MSTLTDRYVWGVLRAVPDKQRHDLEPELREMIADSIDARLASGDGLDAAAAERAALLELGDPELLAARYTDRSLYLIGPAHFLDYKRLLTLLLSIVVPVVTLATMAAGFIAQEAPLPAVVTGLNAGLMVGVQLAFWVTVGFAAVERYGKQETGRIMEWSLDSLPSTPSPARMSASDAITSIVGSVILIGVIAWGPPFITTVDGSTTTVPFFNPELATTWGAWFVGVAVLQIAFAVIVYARGRWGWGAAVGNAILDAAFVIPAIWLLQSGQLLSPQVTAQMEALGAGAAMAPAIAVISVVIVAAIGWDAIEGFLRARRGSRGG